MSDNEKVYDLSMLREMDAEDPGTLKHIVQVFLESIPGILDELLANFRNKDYLNLAGTSHKLKSSLELISMSEIAVLLKKIELQAKAGENLQEIPAMVEKVETTLLIVFDQLKKEIE